MTRQTPVYLNYTQEREILKLVPIATLLLSRKPGGDTIGLDYFVRSAGYEVPTHSCVQHGIIVSLSQVERTERRINGQHRLENQSIGEGNKIASHREYIGDIAPFLAMAAAK